MDNIITLNNESGEVRFEFLDLVEYNGDEFVVLLPADDPDESGEVVILKLDTIDEDAEKESYIGVEDEDTLQAVFNIFKDKFKDEFDFADEEDE